VKTIQVKNEQFMGDIFGELADTLVCGK